MKYSHPTNTASRTCKIRPGPKGTSCLTCKRRHKKCDQRLPICERCEKGGFECLGYNHNSDRRAVRRAVQPSQPQPLILPKPIDQENVLPQCPSPSRSHLETSWFEGTIEARGSTLNSDSWVNENNSLLRAIQSTSKATNRPISVFWKLANLYSQLPCTPTDPLKAFISNPLFDDYLSAQHSRLMERWYFKPTNSQVHTKMVQQRTTSHPQDSLANISQWISLIGIRLCEAFLTGDVSHIHVHNLWIEHIESTLKHVLSYDTTSNGAQKRRSEWLCISLLKTMIISGASTYQVLRSITPVFLQVVFSDPTLWPRECDPACIPLSSILCSQEHMLAYFAFIDCACAMTLGLPQQLEYDTTIYPWSGRSSSHQWAHGSPAEFQLVLADINACRDKSPNARDWREIERWLLTWQSQTGVHIFTESWMTVAWYAVQESWRLALLAYLYMAVCGASSDDLRIQPCIKHMLQVVGTVKKRKSTGAEVSFLVQYLIAGICARTEAHRALVRNKLTDHKEPKFWIMRASDFVPVLDHLWHGAGAGGRPVNWSDYMRSREAMLPVAV
ncbi:unnamed protein product [Rhizoctonia solani]|uniref:Zn(2)-C6 fungal-type domain-containing protein n=1 Tax=Rhizoctonia solani TaxID=456999 RepID=A0A8H2XY62_9AGAM|nr:unnamed protein product [Rhizoctonia solani]